MDVSFDNPWDWVRSRIWGDGQTGGDLTVEGGILGSPSLASAASQSPDQSLPDGGVNLGQARFDDHQRIDQPYAWSGDNGATVYIERPDHSLEIRQGGTLTWRNNNPGNLRSAGDEIGHNDSRNGRLAIFDDPQSGAVAQNGLLFGPNYKGLTIGDAIKKYAPATENNTEAYLADIERRTGLNRSMSVGGLSDAQRASYADAIRAHEGFRPGISRMGYYNLFGD